MASSRGTRSTGTNRSLAGSSARPNPGSSLALAKKARNCLYRVLQFRKAKGRMMAYRSDEEIAARALELLGDRKQAELAAFVGMSESALSKALHGRRRFSVTELAAMAEFLHVEPLELLVKEEETEFVFRADADRAALDEAADSCRQLIEGYLVVESLAGT
jgi:transcriptional regulator with XRE-family HTH domain